MSSTMRYAMEVAGDTATVYVTGSLAATDAFALNRACGELPERVRTLRLDLHGVAHVNDMAMIAVRAVLRYWREARAGSFRLSLASEHLIATYDEGLCVQMTRPTQSDADIVTEATPAQTAMFL
jgi:ABC-type transporter Mla MlaB component